MTLPGNCLRDNSFMEPSSEDIEELLEQLYWEFDTQRSRGSRSERDIFKGKMRFFALRISEEGQHWLERFNE